MFKDGVGGEALKHHQPIQIHVSGGGGGDRLFFTLNHFASGTIFQAVDINTIFNDHLKYYPFTPTLSVSRSAHDLTTSLIQRMFYIN